MKLNTHYNVSKVKLLLLPIAILLSSCNVSTNSAHNETEVLNQQIKELKSILKRMNIIQIIGMIMVPNRFQKN